MSLVPDSATSIRRRLLIFLLPALTALMLAGAFVDYQAALLAESRMQQATLGGIPGAAAGAAAVGPGAAGQNRVALLRYMLATRWLIDFIVLDVTLLLVWIGVHQGLKPLLAVQRQIELNPVRELRSLDAAAVPAEVRPLVETLNLLFEMLREAARAQRQFVADTAHQLRTPLTGLLGSLEVMMREPAAVSLHDRLSALHEGMSRLAHSANQLLALARADPTTSLADQFEDVPLRAIVERIVDQNVDRALASGIDIGAEAEPVSVAGNSRLLTDLLGNLVDNALSYTPRGGRVTVRSGCDQGQPFLEVEDDGPGIPEAERARVRQRFYRIPGSPGRGCGLGLAIVDEISRLHGAELTIDSGAQGRGTRLRVRFVAR
jgi:two-component system, OmpR family, sensor histidine kinase TctE